MRRNLTLEDMGSFLDEPRVAVLATLRRDGTVLLSPVWHEWRDGGFNLWIAVEDVKIRHLRQDPEAHGERITSESIGPRDNLDQSADENEHDPDHDVVEMDTADAPRAPAARACDARVGAGQNERDEKRGKQQRRRFTHHRYQLIPGITPQATTRDPLTIVMTWLTSAIVL